MTGNEMIQVFGLRYGQEISPDIVGLEDTEVVSFLNQALQEVVREYVQSNNLSPVSNLIKNLSMSASVSQTTNITNSVYIDCDPNASDFLYHITSRSKISKSFPTFTLGWVNNEWLDAINDIYVETAEHKPMFQGCKITKNTRGTNTPVFVIVFDGYVTDFRELDITYIRKPVEIAADNVEVDINIGEAQEKVINKAVTFAIEAMMNPRIQTQPIINR